MADNDVEELVDEPQKNDKYNLGASDLEKVNAYEEEKDDVARMGADIGRLTDAPKQKIVKVKPDEVKMIMDELELPKVRVEAALIEHDGDLKATIRSLMRIH